MTTTNTHRGRRPSLHTIGARLNKYTDSNGHYMTKRERGLMLDAAGALMNQPPPHIVADIVNDIRKVSVAHSDLVLQRLADSAARWLDDQPVEAERTDTYPDDEDVVQTSIRLAAMVGGRQRKDKAVDEIRFLLAMVNDKLNELARLS